MKTYSHLPEKLTFRGTDFKMNPEFSAIKRPPQDGQRYRIIYVISRNLKGKTDLFGKPYQPTKWIYTEA